MRVLPLIASLLLCAAAAMPASAQDEDHAVTIEQAWARASAGPARTAAAYVTVTSTGERPDRLVGAETAAADRVELHTHIHEGGVMRMREVEDVALPAGETIAMEPGGLHLMLFGLREPLREGDNVPLTLRFETAGAVATELEVLGVGAAGPGHGH